MNKIVDLESHSRDKGTEIVVKYHPLFMTQLKNKVEALPLDLTLKVVV